ncbi:MAG: RidA family protein [Burkholderiales bacterium]|nr:RidA family protein [Burkholderiales bacterium]
MANIVRRETKAILSKAVEYGGLVYLSGITAENRSQDVKGQTDEILRAIDRLLDKCGSDRSSILSATIWLRDIGERPALNEVWTAWLPQGQAPARACVQAELGPACRVEIQVTAARTVGRA